MLPREVSAFRIVAPEAWKRLGGAGYAKAPVGTGPFKVDNWSPSRIVLSAYRESWRPPKVDGLELLFLPEMSSRTQGIMSGRVDIATTMRVEDRALLESGGHRMVPRPGTGVFVIQFNMTKDPRFRDLRVRQALNYAVNRDGISEVMLGGLIKPASQFTPPNANGYDPTVSAWPYDPDKARALLKEAGYPNGFSFIFEGVLGGGVSDGALFQQIAADLAKVGVIMEIRPLLLTQLSINMHSDTGFIGSAFGTDYGTAPSLDSLRALKLHSCMHPFTWYCDRELQPTVDRALSARTMDERRTLTQAVMRRYREQMPALLLWDIVYFDAVRKEIGEAPAVGTWMIYDRVTKN
jgi:ABC-type transport system substrate-binding protein